MIAFYGEITAGYVCALTVRSVHFVDVNDIITCIEGCDCHNGGGLPSRRVFCVAQPVSSAVAVIAASRVRMDFFMAVRFAVKIQKNSDTAASFHFFALFFDMSARIATFEG